MDERYGEPGMHEHPVREVVARDDAVVVRLAGELDLYNADVLRDALFEALDADSPERIVVDLAEVTFVDSTALGALIEARSRLGRRGAFYLASPGLETRRALEVSGLDRHFDVRESVDAALGA